MLKNSEVLLDRPQYVPTKIVGDENGGNQHSKYAHGAYYNPVTGNLSSAEVLANSVEVRYIPMVTRGQGAYENNIEVPSKPYLKISATKSQLVDRIGWHLKLDMVLHSSL